MLHHESEGWRVVGVAWTVFHGEPPLVLKFEEPEDLIKKCEWWRAEKARREQAEKNPENSAEKPADSTLR